MIIRCYTFDLRNMMFCSRPDESIVSEEMSVYDIKDHPDYKFRPGHVVVRVGGHETEVRRYHPEFRAPKMEILSSENSNFCTQILL